VKGQLIKTACIATTMGPGIKLDLSSLQAMATSE
jgi:ribosomal protein L1